MLAFFAASDGIVLENLSTRFMQGEARRAVLLLPPSALDEARPPAAVCSAPSRYQTYPLPAVHCCTCPPLPGTRLRCIARGLHPTLPWRSIDRGKSNPRPEDSFCNDEGSSHLHPSSPSRSIASCCRAHLLLVSSPFTNSGVHTTPGPLFAWLTCAPLRLPSLPPAEVQIPEARAFYAFQSAIESVHSEMYGLLLEQYISDRVQRDMLFHAVDTIPCVREWRHLGPTCMRAARRAALLHSLRAWHPSLPRAALLACSHVPHVPPGPALPRRRLQRRRPPGR